MKYETKTIAILLVLMPSK